MSGPLVFPGASGVPIDYHNWRTRIWVPLLKKAGVNGTFHMLRHFFVTALIQPGVNAKLPAAAGQVRSLHALF